MKKPETKGWEGCKLVRISDVEGFGDWLLGQTLPLVRGDATPYDWAFFPDYERFINKRPIVD